MTVATVDVLEAACGCRQTLDAKSEPGALLWLDDQLYQVLGRASATNRLSVIHVREDRDMWIGGPEIARAIVVCDAPTLAVPDTLPAG